MILCEDTAASELADVILSCPNEPSDVSFACGSGKPAVSFPSSCGGTSISQHWAGGVIPKVTWHFDQDNELIGVDIIPRAGTESCGGAEHVSYGESCAPTGPETDLCVHTCATQTVCDYSNSRFLDCPTSLQDYVPECSIYGGIWVERYDSKCGGEVIEASDGIQTERWTFTPSGELVGTTWAGDVGDYGCWGNPCEPVGSPEVLCEGSGGAPGGAGAGGAGAGGAGAGGAGEQAGQGGQFE